MSISSRRLFSRTRVAAPLLCGAATVLLAGCGSPGGSASSGPGGQSLQQVTMGVNVPTDFNLVVPQYVARQKGFFRQEGLQVNTVSFQGGADAVKALVAGSIEIDAATGFDAPAAVAKGAPLKVFAGGMMKDSLVLVANNNSGVTSLKQMKGKKIGITKFGSLTDFVARVEGRKAGLSPSQFTEVPLGASEIAPALERGDIALANVNPVDLYPLLAGGKVHVVEKYSAINPDTQFVALVATPAYLNSHSATVKKFLVAYYKAVRYIQSHRAYAITAAAAALHISKSIAGKVYDDLAKDMNPNGEVNTQALQTYASALVTLKIAPKAPALSQYYTGKFIPVSTGS
jgi:NitT/TauT family transport system substrate-binding protein